ncbi:tRNA 2-thiouridine(34) synthase MnmA [Patescibacteria group bacterium]
MNKKVFLAMSGGVDSSVAAGLLLEKGYRVTGVFMKNWTENLAGACPWEIDEQDVRLVCGQLGINYHVYNFEKEYKRQVLNYFFSEYKSGRTPNPDVLCNSKIKFKEFLNKAMKHGADYIATGHYVRKLNNKLLKGTDDNKDQSYFLWQLNNKQINKSLFPVGHLTKDKIRKLAKKWSLPNAKKPDSQGICFIGDIDVADFLRNHIKMKRGEILTSDGKFIGFHDGIMFYTIGQRHGLGVGGGIPYYVINKDIKNNTLIVGHGNRDQALYNKKLTANKTNWLIKPKKILFDAKVKIRYRQPDQAAKIKIKNNQLQVEFYKPQRAITPGQSLVIYKGKALIGGAVINKALKT